MTIRLVAVNVNVNLTLRSDKMASVNKIILVGRLGSDPEIQYTPTGTAKAKFSLATNRKWKDGEGRPQEKVEWHRIVAWGKTAELCGEYLSKGREVYVDGRIEYDNWTDKEGNKRYTTEVIVQEVQFLSDGGGRGGNKNKDVGF